MWSPSTSVARPIGLWTWRVEMLLWYLTWGVYMILWFKRNVYTILIPRDKSPFQNSDDLNISAVRPRLPEALCIALLFLALSKKTWCLIHYYRIWVFGSFTDLGSVVISGSSLLGECCYLGSVVTCGMLLFGERCYLGVLLLVELLFGERCYLGSVVI